MKTTTTKLSDKLVDLATQYTYASGVKDAARLRRQCSLAEWEQVLAEAKRINWATRFMASQKHKQ